MQFFLQKHAPGPAHHRIQVNLSRSENRIILDFIAQKRDASLWNTNPTFTDDWKKSWGLWNNDVVEAFLQLRKDPEDIKAPYLEVQVSPLNQPFALVITEPRKTFFPPEELDIRTESMTEDRTWKSRIEVTLPKSFEGHLLYGGAFSCLMQNPREYYALEPNPEANPDFHRPELFLPLDEA